MPQCHTCPHNAAQSPACLTCPGFGATNHRGRSHVRFEGNPEAERVTSEHPFPDADPAEADPLESARTLLAHLTSLADAELLLLMDRLRGLNGPQSARLRGITRQGIHMRFKKAAARLPWLARFIES